MRAGESRSGAIGLSEVSIDVDGALAGHIRGAGSPTARPWTGDGVPRQRTRDETLVGRNAWIAGNWIASFEMSTKSWL